MTSLLRIMHNVFEKSGRKELAACSSDVSARLYNLPLVEDGGSGVVGADLHVGLWALIDLHKKGY